jgi:hypothetical protein
MAFPVVVQMGRSRHHRRESFCIAFGVGFLFLLAPCWVVSFLSSGAAGELDQRRVERHAALLFLIQVVFGREEEIAARREQALC